MDESFHSLMTQIVHQVPNYVLEATTTLCLYYTISPLSIIGLTIPKLTKVVTKQWRISQQNCLTFYYTNLLTALKTRKNNCFVICNILLKKLYIVVAILLSIYSLKQLINNDTFHNKHHICSAYIWSLSTIVEKQSNLYRL